MPKQNIIVLGAGPFAQEIADLIAIVDGYDVVGFVEGLDRRRCQEPLLGLPVHWIEEIGTLRDSCRAVCAVGSPERKVFIQQAYALGLGFATIVHPAAQISTTSTLGEGSIVGAGAIVASHTVVGRHVIINRGSLIGHHARIGDYVTIGPGANIAGRTSIGSGTFVAMGAIVIDGVSIGSDCLIAAGAVVTRDVPDGARMAGVPARSMEKSAPNAKYCTGGPESPS